MIDAAAKPLADGNGHARNVLEIAREYAAAGLSPVAIKTDGSKKPPCLWKKLQERIADDFQLEAMFLGRVGVGIIGGAVSGGLEILDFDCRQTRPDIFDDFCFEVNARQPGLLQKLPIIETPRGWHIYLRSPKPEGNQVLSLFGGSGGKIETRGTGGYVLAPGCPPECHPTKGLYKHLRGPAIVDTPQITAAERDLLFFFARIFNEVASDDTGDGMPATDTVRGDDLRPGDDFNQRATWDEILVPAGWAAARARGRLIHWRRPGKEGPGTSATTGLRSKAGNELLYVFSSNAGPFEAGRSYSKFSAYAVLDHNGDFSAAASALAARGYGDGGQADDDEPPAVGGPAAGGSGGRRSREKLLRIVRRGLRQPGFQKIIQYGEGKATYELIFETKAGEVAVPIGSTAQLKSLGHVQSAMFEVFHFWLKLSKEQWQKIADCFGELTETRPVPTELEQFFDTVNEFLERGSVFDSEPLDPMKAARHETSCDARTFLGIDGKLYLTLSELHTHLWFCGSSLKANKLPELVTKAGFRKHRLRWRDSVGKQREKWFWVHDGWLRVG